MTGSNTFLALLIIANVGLGLLTYLWYSRGFPETAVWNRVLLLAPLIVNSAILPLAWVSGADIWPIWKWLVFITVLVIPLSLFEYFAIKTYIRVLFGVGK